ncbi:MAG: hypothetical protein K9G62_00895 [Alphaproteobacteria bacterium]|nr:hypothetical protein [Alphaproteobacteria bacterium]
MRSALLLCLPIMLAACADYKTPGLSKSPSSMSSDTLCYRYAATKDETLGAEVRARNLDCAAILESQPF